MSAPTFSGPWSEDFHIGITRVLAKHRITGCGQYEFRSGGGDMYQVRGTGDGEHWTYYLVDVRRETVQPLDRIEA